MDNACYQSNFAALVRHLPAVADKLSRLDAARAPIGSVTVEMSRSGVPTGHFSMADGRRVAMHSRYDPVREAKDQVGELADTNLVVLLGLGLGYLLDEIYEQLSSSPIPLTVAVVEPDLDVFRAYLGSRDATRYLGNRSVLWFIGVDAVPFGDLWVRVLDWGRLEGFRIIEHPPSIARNPEYFKAIKEKIRYVARRSKGNLITVIGTAHEFERNCMQNLPYFFANPGIKRVFGQFTGVPVIIVAAGPSLELAIPDLKAAKGRFPIVAVDTAFRQLVAWGIRPDLVCAADTSYLNALDFVGVENETEVILAVEPMVNQRIFTTFRGPKLIMDFGSTMMGWAIPFAEEKGTIDCWGSISTTAFDIALKMGANPVVMVGLDLSFDEGMLHARGSYSDDIHFSQVTHLGSLEHEISSYINKFGVNKLTGRRGQTVYTDGQMQMYREWFTDRFKHLDRPVINATAGGVHVPGAEDLPLGEVLVRYADRAVDVAAVLRRIMGGDVPMKLEAARAVLRRMLADLTAMADCARRNLQFLRQLAKEIDETTMIADLTGHLRAQWIDLTADVGRVLGNEILTAWFNNHALKVVTWYNQETMRLIKERDNRVDHHMESNRRYFEEVERFCELFLPLIRDNIRRFEAEPQQFKARYR